MTRVLFVCSRNRRRSPTAEHVFRDVPGIETASAGLSPDADHRLTQDDVEWADVVVVMEPVHRRRLTALFGPALREKRVVTLGIPDDYDVMHPALIERLLASTRRILP